MGHANGDNDGGDNDNAINEGLGGELNELEGMDESFTGGNQIRRDSY